MKKRISVILALIVAAITLFSAVPAFAALTEGTKYSFTEKYLNAYYDTGSWQTANGDYHDNYGQVALRNLSNNDPIYCIQIYNGAEGSAATAKSIDKTDLWNNEYSSKAQDIVRHVSIWGYPNYTYGYSKDNAQLATQVLIWEAEIGKRTNYSTTATSFANGIFSNYPDAKKCYTSILEACGNHSKVPKFSPTSVKLTKTGESNGVTITDSNGILSQFKISSGSSNIKFSQSGNKLKIWCTATGTYNATIKLTKKNTDLNTAYALTGANQTLFYGTLSDPVQATVNVSVDTPKYCRVTVTKRDAKTHYALSGAEFKIQQAVFAADGSYTWQDIKNVDTYSNGSIYIAKKLEYTTTNRGWFKVVETKAPAGYKLNPTFIADDHTPDLNYTNEYRESDGAFKFDPAQGAEDNYMFYYIVDDPLEKCQVSIRKLDDTTGVEFTPEQYAQCKFEIWEYTKYDVDKGNDYQNPAAWRKVKDMFVNTNSDNITRLRATDLEWTEKNGGWFKIVEAKAPAGYTTDARIVKDTRSDYRNKYVRDDGRFHFDPATWPTDDAHKNFDFYFKYYDPQDTGNCKIIKTSDDGKVSGIQFTVTGDGYNQTVTTGSDGTFLLEGLKPGTYTVTEKVPAGYKCTSKNPQTVTVKSGETATVTFENNLLYGNIELTKVDEEYPDNKLTGAEFTVTIVKDGKTTTQKMKEVSTGVYRLEHIVYNSVCTIKETKAPEGFVLSNESFKVTILEEKTYTVASKDFDCVTNRPIKGSLKIVKMNRGDVIPLEGAGFRLFNAKGEKVAEGYTDADGELLFEGLRYGKYTYREFKAPKGFTLDDTEYELEITTDGKVIEARRINDPILGSITVHKANENGNALAGAVFLCEWSTDGKTFSPIRDRGIFVNMAAVGTCTNKGIKDGTLTVGSDGVVKFEGLRIYDADGKDVIYRITEIKAPKGYQLLKEPAFEGKINADGSGEEAEFTVVNSHIYVLPAAGSMQIIYVGASIGVALLSAALISTIIIYRRKHNNKNK